MPKPTFDVTGFLQDQGETAVRPGATPGTMITVNSEGKEGVFDYAAYLRDEHKLDYRQVDMTANAPDMAAPESPVGFWDRLKMSFGDHEGNVASLKKTFEDASTDSNGDIIVKDRGFWHKVDGEATQALANGDPWAFTKEILGDVADVGGEIASMGTTAGVAWATGGTSLLAMGAAGVAGGSMKVVLGKAAGTYGGDLGDMANDALWEGVGNLAGEGIYRGAKSVYPAIRAGIQSMSAANKQFVAQGIAATGGANVRNVEHTLINHKEVLPLMDGMMTQAQELAPKLGAVTAEDVVIRQRSRAILTDALGTTEQAPYKMVTDRYGKMAKDIADNAPSDFRYNINDSMYNFLADMEKNGWIQLKRDNNGGITKVLQGDVANALNVNKTVPESQIHETMRIAYDTAEQFHRQFSTPASEIKAAKYFDTVEQLIKYQEAEVTKLTEIAAKGASEPPTHLSLRGALEFNKQLNERLTALSTGTAGKTFPDGSRAIGAKILAFKQDFNKGLRASNIKMNGAHPNDTANTVGTHVGAMFDWAHGYTDKEGQYIKGAYDYASHASAITKMDGQAFDNKARTLLLDSNTYQADREAIDFFAKIQAELDPVKKGNFPREITNRIAATDTFRTLPKGTAGNLQRLATGAMTTIAAIPQGPRAMISAATAISPRTMVKANVAMSKMADTITRSRPAKLSREAIQQIQNLNAHITKVPKPFRDQLYRQGAVNVIKQIKDSQDMADQAVQNAGQ